MSHHKMKGNYYWYLADTGDDKNKAAEDARVEYAEPRRSPKGLGRHPSHADGTASVSTAAEHSAVQLHLYGDGKVSLDEIFAEMGDPASLRDEFVKAFKEADEDGDGLPNEEEGEALLKFVDEMEGHRVSEQHMVLSQSRGPGFVVTLDTDGDVE